MAVTIVFLSKALCKGVKKISKEKFKMQLVLGFNKAIKFLSSLAVLEQLFLRPGKTVGILLCFFGDFGEK